MKTAQLLVGREGKKEVYQVMIDSELIKDLTYLTTGGDFDSTQRISISKGLGHLLKKGGVCLYHLLNGKRYDDETRETKGIDELGEFEVLTLKLGIRINGEILAA